MTGQRQAQRTESPVATADRPHAARVHDCLLGGTSHHEADALAAAEITDALPVAPAAARAHRDFLVRATRLLASEFGIRQFLDLGSGFLTEPNLHTTALSCAPDSRVVYADNDPVVLQHARALLDSGPEGRTAFMRVDVTDPESVLDAPELSDTLDLGRPVALSVNSLLHFIPDGRQPYAILRTLLSALPAGSCLVLSHATADFVDQGTVCSAQAVLGRYAEFGAPLRPRSRPEVAAFFEGLRLLGPGLVPPQLWRPDAPAVYGPRDIPGYAGVARKL